MNHSMRLRLLVATSISTVVLLSLLGLSIYVAVRNRLLSDYDASLMAKARAMSATAEQRDGRVKFELDLKQMPELSALNHPEYFESWLDDGQVLIRSQSLHGDLPRMHAGAAEVTLPSARRGRSVTLTFTPRPSRSNHSSVRTCTIVIAGAPVEAERMLRDLGWLLLALCGTAIVISGVILLRIVNRALKPVKQLAHGIEGIRETDLTYRLSPEGAPRELLPVVDKLNGLLCRLEKAFAREQAFTADVAHELRTPIAGLLTTLEVCCSQRREPAAYDATLDECRAMTDRMAAMIENLLMLARADAGQLAVERRRIDAGSLLTETWLQFDHSAEVRHLQIHWDVGDECEADTDPDILRIVIQNLFNNALSYTEEGGSIRVVAANRNDRLLIEVTNTGSIVTAEDVPHLFERFWMGDQGRSKTGVHCGLGLSLSQRLIALLGGQIAIEVTSDGEFVVKLFLPNVKPYGAGDGKMESSLSSARVTTHKTETPDPNSKAGSQPIFASRAERHRQF